jgi:integrase
MSEPVDGIFAVPAPQARPRGACQPTRRIDNNNRDSRVSLNDWKKEVSRLNAKAKSPTFRLRAEQRGGLPDKPVMQVFECQKSIDRDARLAEVKRITRHDLRHLFATRCIESGVDIPTVSRRLGHQDGGAPCMKAYGYLRNEHSTNEAKKVGF